MEEWNGIKAKGEQPYMMWSGKASKEAPFEER